jgi:hypothetical protein
VLVCASVRVCVVAAVSALWRQRSSRRAARSGRTTRRRRCCTTRGQTRGGGQQQQRSHRRRHRASTSLWRLCRRDAHPRPRRHNPLSHTQSRCILRTTCASSWPVAVVAAAASPTCGTHGTCAHTHRGVLYTYTRTHTHTHKDIHSHTHTHTHTHMHSHTQAHTLPHTHTHKHTPTHTSTHKHTHTHTHALSLSRLCPLLSHCHCVVVGRAAASFGPT